MRTKITLVVLTLGFLTNCKKTYNCECTGSSVHNTLFNDMKTVKEKNKAKAEHSCALKEFDYSNQYDTSNPDGLAVVNCHLK